LKRAEKTTTNRGIRKKENTEQKQQYEKGEGGDEGKG
jgi:hypothetical protein